MKTDRWSLIEKVFQGALDRPPAERERYVEKACENDTELLPEIESLLESDKDAESVLRSLIAEDLREGAQTSNLSKIDLQLGPYHLVRELTAEGWRRLLGRLVWAHAVSFVTTESWPPGS
jgi:eukaryotic-like serine/threonine-protein kinase